MTNIVRLNELPEGSGSLTNDDILLFMDDPSGSGISKKISLSEISNAIGGGGSGNPFDQELNTTDFPTFSGVSLSNGTTLAQGTFDNMTGGNNGISINCVVGYELNWQGGHLKSTVDAGVTAANILCDSAIEFPGGGADNVEINNSGIVFADGSVQSMAGVVSDTGLVANSSGIVNMVQMTQANYDSLGSYDVNTLYIIVE